MNPKSAPPCWLLALVLPLAGPVASTDGLGDDDARRVREAAQAGRLAPLEQILDDALRRVPGRIVSIELDFDDDTYEIEILDDQGRLWELEYRASSGRFRAKEPD